tara:strand:- start:3784 stop:3981 length:198 start_codon:yes stop_codon:yes gene_type:complete
VSAKAYPLIINGKEVESKAKEFYDVFNPATQELVGRVPLTTQEEMRAASDNAQVLLSIRKECCGP